MIKLRSRWHPLASSNIHACLYFKRQKKLLIEFTSGTIYAYDDVPWGTYLAFRRAKSHGSYFSSHIRNEYEYRQLSPVDVPESVNH